MECRIHFSYAANRSFDFPKVVDFVASIRPMARQMRTGIG